MPENTKSSSSRQASSWIDEAVAEAMAEIDRIYAGAPVVDDETPTERGRT